MHDFEHLYARYGRDVFRFALYLCGNRADAEDIAAETFARAWTSRDRLRRRRPSSCIGPRSSAVSPRAR